MAAIPMATMTTLPPASPTANTIDPCTFVNRMELFSRIRSSVVAYNISLLVETCPNLCTDVYGSGNPDISGIGVSCNDAQCEYPYLRERLNILQAMISYILQGIAVFLFGPCLILAAYMQGALNSKYSLNFTGQSLPSRKRILVLAKISLNINQGSIFVALSTSVASIIRITQDPPLNELSFICYLNLYEMFVSVGVIAPLLVMADLQKRKTKVLYLFNILALLLTFTASIQGVPAGKDAEVVLQVFESCFSPPNIVNQEAKQKPKFWGWQNTIAICIGGSTIVPMILAKLYRRKFQRVYERVDTFLLRYFRTTLKHVRAGVVIGFGICSWTFLCYAFIIILQQQRKKTQYSSGKEYEDHRWGFGQVTILLLWVPLLSDIFLDIRGEQWFPFKNKRFHKLIHFSMLEYYKPESPFDVLGAAFEQSHSSYSSLRSQGHNIPLLSRYRPQVDNVGDGGGGGEGTEDSSDLLPSNVEDTEEPSDFLPFNDEELAGLENLQTTALVTFNDEINDRFFQYDSDDNSLFQSETSAAASGENTPTRAEDEIQTPSTPQIRYRTWPRNEEGTYLPTRNMTD